MIDKKDVRSYYKYHLPIRSIGIPKNSLGRQYIFNEKNLLEQNRYQGRNCSGFTVNAGRGDVKRFVFGSRNI